MDKNLVGMIGAVGALLAFAPAQVATAHSLAGGTEMQVNSYADLLKPISNALALLTDVEAAQIAAEAPISESRTSIQEAQLIINLGGQKRRRHHHHHHHHHHQT